LLFSVDFFWKRTRSSRGGGRTSKAQQTRRCEFLKPPFSMMGPPVGPKGSRPWGVGLALRPSWAKTVNRKDAEVPNRNLTIFH